MKYKIRLKEKFLQQLNELNEQTKRIIYRKLDLIEKNPYRYTPLHNNFGLKAFKFRLNIQNKESRVLYVIKEPEVKILSILPRKHDYKDLEMHLKRLKEPEA